MNENIIILHCNTHSLDVLRIEKKDDGYHAYVKVLDKVNYPLIKSEKEKEKKRAFKALFIEPQEEK